MPEDPFELEVQRLFAQAPDLGGEARFEKAVLSRVTGYQQLRARVLTLLTIAGVISATFTLWLSGVIETAARAMMAWAQSSAATGEALAVAAMGVGPVIWVVLVMALMTGATVYSFKDRLL